MAFQDSPQAREDAQESPTPVEFRTCLIDADGIFGFTSHLLKRKQKVGATWATSYTELIIQHQFLQSNLYGNIASHIPLKAHTHGLFTVSTYV